jgi:hypothetical protein
LFEEATNFSVYTELVSNNQGNDLAIQSLPNTGLENMEIPVGINAPSGASITFSLEKKNLPGVYVYLEDRVANIFTQLDPVNTSYQVTLTTAANGTGRFYIHTPSQALDVDTVHLNPIKIYKTSPGNLRLSGLPYGATLVKLYTIQGREVLHRSFQTKTTGTEDIPLPILSSGVYLVQLKTRLGKLTKKIIME